MNLNGHGADYADNNGGHGRGGVDHGGCIGSMGLWFKYMAFFSIVVVYK